MVEAAESKKSEKKVSSATNENNNSTNVEQGVAKPVESNNEKAEEDTTNPVIYGRVGKMSDPLVKVADLTIDSGKVMIDGEILATETRELKSGKIKAMFN